MELTRQPVELFKVLKLSGLAGSGGEAKMLIAAEAVTVNGEIETRKRRKIVDGDRITFEQELLLVRCPNAPAPADASD